MLEIKDLEIPKENPNPINDVYREDAMGWPMLIVIIPLFIFTMYVLNSHDFGFAHWVKLIFECCYILFMIFFCYGWYKSTLVRRRIMEKGTPYVGVIYKVEEYELKKDILDRPNPLDVKYIRYNIRIKYELGEMLLYGLYLDARLILENQYCTIYKYGNKEIATNFKVADQYISKKGKITTKKGVPTTWGEAIELRVGKQKSTFRNGNPFGSFEMVDIK